MVDTDGQCAVYWVDVGGRKWTVGSGACRRPIEEPMPLLHVGSVQNDVHDPRNGEGMNYTRQKGILRFSTTDIQRPTWSESWVMMTGRQRHDTVMAPLEEAAKRLIEKTGGGNYYV